MSAKNKQTNPPSNEQAHSPSPHQNRMRLFWKEKEKKDTSPVAISNEINTVLKTNLFLVYKNPIHLKMPNMATTLIGNKLQ